MNGNKEMEGSKKTELMMDEGQDIIISRSLEPWASS